MFTWTPAVLTLWTAIGIKTRKTYMSKLFFHTDARRTNLWAPAQTAIELNSTFKSKINSMVMLTIKKKM